MVSSTVNREHSFLLEFYICCRVSQKNVFLLLIQEHIYTIKFHSLVTTKRRKITRGQTMLISIRIPQ